MTHDKESAVVLTDRPVLALYFGLSNRFDFIVFIPELSPIWRNLQGIFALPAAVFFI